MSDILDDEQKSMVLSAIANNAALCCAENEWRRKVIARGDQRAKEYLDEMYESLGCDAGGRVDPEDAPYPMRGHYLLKLLGWWTEDTRRLLPGDAMIELELDKP